MTKIMVCGSRQESDIELLVAAGVDAIGLITEVSQPLPCNLSREQARRLSALVPPLMNSVLILTEERIEEICRLVEHVRPSAVQLHGFNGPEAVTVLKKRLPVKIIKTLHLQGNRLLEGDGRIPQIRPGDTSNVDKQPDGVGLQPDNHSEKLIAAYLEAGADAILLDSCQANKVGSTGQVADFATARQLRDAVWPRPFILAGGLQAKNATDALRRVEPYGVDVFSGVNHQGYLDPPKVQAFVRTVRRFQA